MDTAVKGIHFVQGLHPIGKWIAIAILAAIFVGLAWLVLQEPPKPAPAPTLPTAQPPKPPIVTSSGPNSVAVGGDVGVASGGVGVNYGIVTTSNAATEALTEQLRIQNENNARREAEEVVRRELNRKRGLALRLARDWVDAKGDGIPDRPVDIFIQATPYINAELEKRGETWRLSPEMMTALSLP